MKLKRLMALGMAAVMTMSLTACGGSGDKPTGGSTEADNKTASNDSAPTGSDAADGSADAAAGGLTYAGIKLGEDYTDITTTIKWMHHKTDRVEDGTLQGY
ncbi:MAG: carbohydrate ABC transporter substrate-binding protein, partial [Lachnospiraceae bacterium]|nr:carbohydrate ABC transporter substrate-binding protein [Lachnospiraceae bacterium]